MRRPPVQGCFARRPYLFGCLFLWLVLGCGDVNTVKVETDHQDIAVHIERVIEALNDLHAMDVVSYDEVGKAMSKTCKAIEQAHQHAQKVEKRKLGKALQICRQYPSALKTRCAPAALKGTLEDMLEYL